MKFTVVSLNLWHGKLLDQALAWLKHADADILILQEVYNGVEPALERRLRTFSVLRRELRYPSAEFCASGLVWLDGNRVAFGNAILAKWPVAEREAKFFDTPFNRDYVDTPDNWPTAPRVIQRVVLNSPVGELDVLNVHGPWDLVGERNSRPRQRMAAGLMSFASGRELVVAAGDTNAKPVNAVWRPVNLALHNVFSKELKSTFNMRHKDNPGYASAAVDMMFVSRSIEVIARDCPDVDISDHMPLIATLRVD